MFTFASQPQSVTDQLKDSWRFYVTHGRDVLGASLVFAALYVIFMSLERLVVPLFYKLIEDSAPILKSLLATNLIIYNLIFYFALTFTLTVIIYRLYRMAIELPESVMQCMRYACTCILRMFALIFMLVITTIPTLQLLVIPGLISASLLVFSLLYVICEDARFDVALKSSVLLVWNHGGTRFVNNLMRSIIMLFYPVLIKYGSFVILTWLTQWLSPLFQWLGQPIYQLLGPANDMNYALALNHMLVQFIVTSLLLPLQVAALLVVFNDLKRRYSAAPAYSAKAS